MDSNDIISNIIYSDETYIECLGKYDFKVSMFDTDGSWIYALYSNEKEEIMDFLNSAKLDFFVALDYRFLDNDILDILRRKDIKVIRIIGENYTLTLNDYKKLSFLRQIIVDKISPEINYQPGEIIEQNNIFKKEYKNFIFNEITYFVDRPLAQLEIACLVYEIKKNCSFSYNKKENKLLSIRFYNVEEYKRLLEMLRYYKLPKDVKIQLMGNPLKDSYSTYKELSEIIDNPIEIIYNSNQNILKYYQDKPYTRYNYYSNELEAGDICPLSSYLTLLNVLDSEEEHIQKREYSPLEILVYIYRYLHQNYLYSSTDINSKNKFTDIKYVQRRIMLSGNDFPILLSLLARRCGLSVFNYLTDNHIRNIAYINDSKYDISCFGFIDPEWDSVYKTSSGTLVNQNSYTYFMLPLYDTLRLEKPEIMSVPAVLSLDKNDIERLENISKNEFMTKLNYNYTACLFSFSLLHMLGYNPKTWDEFYAIIEEINHSTMIDTLKPEKIRAALEYVEQSEIYNLDVFKKLLVLRSFDMSIISRKFIFFDIYRIKCLDGTIEYVEPLICKNEQKKKTFY